ncbi:LysR family transcriptional regulator [Oceanicola sp. S124]|uniref:LysR family transcriptional regulator n=1 Tax=Oceanicola sp. S124 TaxID=1042378 RepID=UPI0002559F48|nr:LysR family transcriptional regulator [Oceanicola sp. S124]
MLTLRHYELLVTLAGELHFGRAAERLGISQPQLTQQLKQMEELIGTMLFERNRRKVELAPAGRLLLPEARAVLRHAAKAQEVALQVGQGRIGELALGYIGAASYSGVLARLLRLYRDRAPDVRLQLTAMDLDLQYPEVSAGNLDAGIVRLPYPNMPENVVTRTLLQERLWIALPVDHPQAASDGVRLADLASESFIGTHLPPSTGFSASMHRAFAAVGIAPQVVHRCPQFASIVSLVSAGLGLAVVPESMKNLVMQDVVYRPLTDVDETANISIVYQQHRESPALELFLSCLDGMPE